MSNAKLMLPCPPFLPENHFSNPQRAIMTQDGDQIATYCVQTATGAVFRLGTQCWVLTGPVALGEFLGALAANGALLPDGEDLQRWLDAVAGPDHVAALLARH